MRRFFYTLVACATILVPGLVATGGPATAAEPPYTITTLHFKVVVGPKGDEQPCDIIGDLYVPRGATATNRMPAVLSTNGFGGSKDDQAGLSKLFASNGYVALSYSGLGFGGSSCKITLDDPDHDGEAAARLIDYLGGADGIAFSDAAHANPVAPLDKVTLDGPGDPRVGMFGGSYGGQIQYAAASVTSKLDTIVPFITWNDLSYSLAPNNTDQTKGVSTGVPGAAKLNWALGFSALGLLADPQNNQPPTDALPCPNFADFVCPALLFAAVTGTLSRSDQQPDVKHLQAASVSSYLAEVNIPTLILQGQADTLFNLNEAVATYQALQKQETEVKMSWIEYGHSGDPAPGEIDFDAPNPNTQHITRRVFDWFAHYLKKDASAPTGPEFSYFRDWVRYTGIASPAYQSEASYPVGTPATYHLSSTPTSTLTGGALVTDWPDVTTGTEHFTTPGSGAPASTAEDPDVVSSYIELPEQAGPIRGEVAATSAQYDTDALSRQVDVVGSPQVRLQVQAPEAKATQAQDPGKLVLFLKIVDVAANGTGKVVRNLAAPVRIPDVDDPFTVTMPAFVHRFETGHRIRLVVAGASPNYRGSNLPVGVTVATVAGGESAQPLPTQSLTLPIVGSVPASTGGTTNNGGGPGTPAVPGGGAGTPAAPEAGDGNSGSGSTTVNGPGSGTAQGSAQAGPAVGASTTSSDSLPDTGGPSLGLLAAGLLLTVLGAHQLFRYRRLRIS